MFEVYRAPSPPPPPPPVENSADEAAAGDGKEDGQDVEEEWMANEFVRDAFKIRMCVVLNHIFFLFFGD